MRANRSNLKMASGWWSFLPMNRASRFRKKRAARSCQSLRSSSLRFKRVMRSIGSCKMARISAGRPGRDKQKM